MVTGKASDGGVVLSRLSKAYGRLRAVDSIDLSIPRLVLDEPTAAIDVEGRREFWTAIREVAAAGKTVIFATHYLEEADAYADRIVLLARGKIVADGPATEIRAKAILVYRRDTHR
jgi:ABC-2 type transport system ATP-binding protein